jgi:hypothetical protein
METDILLKDCIKYSRSKGGAITEADLQKKFRIGYMRAERLLSKIREFEYKKGGESDNKKRKKEIKLVLAQVPSGSLCIPPNKIKKLFKIVFNAGMKCQEMHPDDDTYDDIHFNDALSKVFKSFPKDARPY